MCRVSKSLGSATFLADTGHCTKTLISALQQGGKYYITLILNGNTSQNNPGENDIPSLDN